MTTIPETPTTALSIPAPPFDTPTEAADAYLTAKFTGNYQQLEPLMGTDGQNNSYMFSSPGDAQRMEMRFAWEQATLGPYSDLECVGNKYEIVSCTYTSGLLDMTRSGADGTNTYTQTVRLDPDGFLLSVGLEEPTFTAQHRTAAMAFNVWLMERHRDLIAEEEAIYGTDVVDRTLEEIRADWVAAIDEYVAENG